MVESNSRRRALKRVAGIGAAAATQFWSQGRAAQAPEVAVPSKGERVDCRDFPGLDPTGSTPCDAAINSAIAAGIANHMPVYLPSGTYRIGNPLIANPFARKQGYANLQFSGAGGLGSLDPIGASSRAQTVIVASFTDRPALALDLMSGAVFKDFAVQGSNSAPDKRLMPIDDQAAYIGPGCRNNRYSPYCAIAIDACNNAGLPSQDRYPGMSDEYFHSSGGSAGVTFENIWIANFVVGIAYGISGYSANTEDILFQNVWISRVDTCYAVGHTQARHCLMQMGNLGFARQGIDGYHYGAQEGCPPKFDRVNHGFLYRIFSLPNWVGNFVLDDNYAESIRTLGNFGLGSNYSRPPLTFNGGDYTVTSADNEFSAPPPLLLETYSPTVFKGVCISRDANSVEVDTWNVISADTVCSFEQCYLTGTGVDRIPPFIGSVKDIHGVIVRLKDCYLAAAKGGAMYLSDEIPRSYGLEPFAPGGRFCATYQSRWVSDGNREYLYLPHEAGNVQCSVDVSELALPASNGGYCTFITSAKHLLLNDILYWLMRTQGPSRNQWVVPALKVLSIEGSNVRCRLLFDAREYDSVANWSVNNAGRMFIAVRQWAPAQVLTCDMHDSTTITALSHPGILIGNSATTSGDWVCGAGIQPNTRVLSVDEHAGRAVLSHSTSGGAASGVRIYFGRLYAPTLSEAF